MYPKMVYDFSGELKNNFQLREERLKRSMSIQEIIEYVSMYACCMVLEFKRQMDGFTGVNQEEYIPFILDCVCKAAALANSRFVYSVHSDTTKRLIYKELSTSDIQERVNKMFGE